MVHMINYEKAHREMVKYLAPFDHRDPMIRLKIRHTFEVVRLSKMIAAASPRLNSSAIFRISPRWTMRFSACVSFRKMTC